MIIKKKDSDRKTNPFIGILLFFVSVILMVLTAPMGLAYGILHAFFTDFLPGIGDYCMKMAVSVDQLGNVIMQHLLNLLWINKDGYKFGNSDETISSALGKNVRMDTLTGFGKMINAMLDFIDPNHTLDSIEYEVKI